MGQTQKIGSHKTEVFTDNGFTTVVYHNTPVVKFNYDKIILNHGGYTTFTTKTRMNQASNQFDLGYYVYQKNFDWFVSFNDKDLPFDERVIELDRRNHNETT